MAGPDWLLEIVLQLPRDDRTGAQDMTSDWIIFGVVMPAIVAGLGWIAVLAHERDLREREKRTRNQEEER